MKEVLKMLLQDSVLPNHLREVKWLMDFLSSSDTPPVFLSLGETWEEIDTSLSSLLSSPPAYTHGYQLSMYGLPSFRNVLADYIQKDHALEVYERGRDYEVAVSWTGTRDAMRDFGFLFRDKFAKGPSLKLLTFAPGFDYKGVFSQLGLETVYLPLNTVDFSVDIEACERALNEQPEGTVILALNTQHNPTSVNWDTDTVSRLLATAVARGFGIIIDDAHFGVRESNLQPTSALRILLDTIQATNKKSYPWLAIRSLGKQFGINGWGIGAVTAVPELLDSLVNDYRAQHVYNYAGVFQYALCEWMRSGNAQKTLERRNGIIFGNKESAALIFQEKFGYPKGNIFAGPCTSFMLFSLPVSYAQRANGSELFVLECLQNTGILLTGAWPKPYNTTRDFPRYDFIRMYCGCSTITLTEALVRLERGGFHYRMESFKKSLV
jgi:N-succinyldiaminopimelate aminotransferase